MNHILNVKDKKMNILLSIFLTGALILAPLGVNAFAQGGANYCRPGNSSSNKTCTKCFMSFWSYYWSSMQQH